MTAEATFVCSRAGCDEIATSSVEWRNPRIHDESRVKVWLACDAHREYLRDYLASRDFPVTVRDGASMENAR
ncbi:hypothetical protein ACFSBZ_03495 [Amnibacterium flavum]|uniref:Acetone carboxylase n=1 Tax=Amnibacterium flavum TaxID=2173173 RepID=A0A2V1HPG9_9MICO|nr:hypothetical protein [Amnibacterium flavum]PVZ94425.1 hypothetical protein DDQ50_11975 [Amnibacterium flavum]